MTELEINKIIHEARGLCWHEPLEKFLPSGKNPHCKHCNKKLGDNWDGWNPSYTSSWEAWGAALEWAMKEEWWSEFIAFLYKNTVFIMGVTQFERLAEVMLAPKEGSTAFAEFITSNPDLDEF